MIHMEYLKIQSNLQSRFPGLAAQIVKFYNVNVQRELQELEDYKIKVINNTQAKWEVEKLRETHVFRAYRDFFWKLDIDPTKNRPAAEALIRRVLRGRPIPKINTWVDAYNLVSITSTIPIASFDLDLLEGELYMREAKTGEEFLGIGMRKPVNMKGGETVIEDGTRLVAIYPYRDADYSKVSMKTTNVLMLMCGAPGITLERLNASALEAEKVLPRFCGGKVE
jgi:DNA/RNA-binding domain of Phe-tRNA-synthetase-like protein